MVSSKVPFLFLVSGDDLQYVTRGCVFQLMAQLWQYKLTYSPKQSSQLFWSDNFWLWDISRNSFVPTIHALQTRGNGEIPACILSSQDTMISSPNLPYQAGVICSQARSSANKQFWAFPYEGKHLQINTCKCKIVLIAKKSHRVVFQPRKKEGFRYI